MTKIDVRDVFKPDNYMNHVEEVMNSVFSDGNKFTDVKNSIIEVTDGNDETKMTLGSYLFNVVSLKVYSDTDSYPPLEMFFNDDHIDSGSLYNHIDHIIKTKIDQGIDSRLVSNSISDSLMLLGDIGNKTNYARGNTVNLYSLGELYKTSEEFKNIVNFKLPEDAEFSEIEQIIEDNQQSMVDALTESDTPYRTLFNSGSAINVMQAVQVFLTIGLKPDLEGRIIPHVINTSFLKGLRGEADYFVDALSGRKALITNFQRVKDSGYLNRKLSLLVIDMNLTGEDECDTVHFIPINVSTKGVFNRIVGRYTPSGTVIKEEHRDRLIGRTLLLRSPITCTSKHDDGRGGICNKCYGKMYAINKEYHVGILAVLYLTSKLTQLLLSSKHLLQTQSPQIEWPEEFRKYFSVSQSEIRAKKKVKNVSVHRREVNQDDDGLFVSSITVNDEIVIDLPINIHLTNRLAELYRSSNDTMLIQNMTKENRKVFNVIIDNIELGESLNQILQLIERKDHIGLENNIVAITNTFLELLDESNIHIQSNHIEIILKMLVRDPENLSFPPDFSKYPEGFEGKTNKRPPLPPLEVLTVTRAILTSPNLSETLSFENIKRQFSDINTFEKKGTGILDNVFV